MVSVDYLIIGGGIAGTTAAETFREKGGPEKHMQGGNENNKSERTGCRKIVCEKEEVIDNNSQDDCKKLAYHGISILPHPLQPTISATAESLS